MVAASAEAPKAGKPNRTLSILVLSLLALNVYQQLLWSTRLRPSEAGASVLGEFEPFEPRPEPEDDDDDGEDDEDDEAQTIIRRSYERSYARILPCDDAAPSGRACMKRTLDHFSRPAGAGTASNDTLSAPPPIPWWFQTLLRDVQRNGVYGFWHHFTTSDPPLNFCTIGKVATTEWRKTFCKLNAEECAVPNSCGKRGCVWRTKGGVPEDAPWAVFLRDPLERLLSGYLDKCQKPLLRKNEGHCEPNAVFNPQPNMTDARGKALPSLMEHLEGTDKQMFAAYVDVLPLKWNVHFTPQALACDLHRRIGEYDFVGNMGRDFMFDLERMAERYGGKLPEVLDDQFNYAENVRSRKRITGKEHNRHATHASAKVAKYYTAQTVRRGLELLSIDYVLLGLEVPEWARQMLREDTN